MLEGRQTQRFSTEQSLHGVSLAGTRLHGSSFLSSEDRRMLEMAAHPAKSIASGNDIALEGGRASLFQIVVEGWAFRYKTTRTGGRQIVALLVPGDTVNLDAFLCDRLDYGVRTLTPARIVAIPRDLLLMLAEQYPGIAKALAGLAFAENAILRQSALCLGRRAAKPRIAHLLCELGARLGGAEGETHFELPLTQEQLGDVLGLTAVHVNRMMQQLRGAGLIKIKGRSVLIPDKDALREVAEFDPSYLDTQHDLPGSAIGHVPDVQDGAATAVQPQ